MKKVITSLGSSFLILALSLIGFSGAKISRAATPVLTNVLVAPATPTIDVGGTVQLTASLLDQDGLPFVGATTTFFSSDTAIASVDLNTGLVTGVALGSL